MTNLSSIKDKPEMSSSVSYLEFMDSAFAELVVGDDATRIFDAMLARLSSTSARQKLGQALCDYVECASALVRVRVNKDAYETPCLRVVENCHLDVLEDSQLERYVLPLILRPDFRLLSAPIKTVRQRANKVGLDWEHVAPIITRIADRFSRRVVESGHPEQRLPEVTAEKRLMKGSSAEIYSRHGERDPNVAARRTELGNVLRSDPDASARKICTRWDFKNIRVPERWLQEGIVTWATALQKNPNKVRKLISTDKKAVMNQLR
jgi:hypothetical protein